MSTTAEDLRQIDERLSSSLFLGRIHGEPAIAVLDVVKALRKYFVVPSEKPRPIDGAYYWFWRPSGGWKVAQFQQSPNPARMPAAWRFAGDAALIEYRGNEKIVGPITAPEDRP
jgi:hypothetical protein